MLFRIAVVIVNYFSVKQYPWLLCTFIFLSLSTLILIVQPYKKGFMNVVDGLLLAVLGFLTLLIATFLYNPATSNQTLALIIVIVCGLPQLVLLLSVTYRQLKGKQISRYIAGKVSIMLKHIHKPVQQENQPSDADQLPHRLTSPNQYNRSLTSEFEQTYANNETLSVRGQLTPVYPYGSIS